MKRLLLLLFILPLVGAGCISGMTNDEIIAETLKCEEAGLEAVVFQNPSSGRWIKCLPKSL